MINADFELDRLRSTLRMQGYSDFDVEQTVRAASLEIGQAITDALTGAMQQAVEAGTSVEADEFVSELRAVSLNNDYYISTDSGQMDFSEPPFPMLSALLKNPKVAKDGSLYKVIPVGNGQGRKNPVDLAEAQNAINSARNAAIDSMGPNSDAHTGPMTFSGTFAAQKGAMRNKEIRKAIVGKNSKGANFKTASSKQDPLKNWVKPAKDKDMTNAVGEINIELRQSIDAAIVSIIQKYTEGQY